MNKSSATLSLTLPPEVSKIMPWIVSAKASGNPRLLAWAKQEYEIAQEKARWREQRERETEERRLRFAYEQQLREEAQEREFLAWQQEQGEQQARLERLGIHFALEDGWEEIQPTQGSSGGGLRYQWGRAQEEGIRDPSFWDRSWLAYMGRSNQNYSRHNNFRGSKHNCGRKPRKPWFK